MQDFQVPPGMPLSVWENKYARRRPDGSFESWAERVAGVVDGNFLLDPRRGKNSLSMAYERDRTLELARTGILAFSGRHLQNGDATQGDRLLELFTNCSTSMFSFQLFRLLLRGSGVGRDYSAACCRVDWSNMPDVRLVLDEAHPDFRPHLFRGALEPLRGARHKYDSESERVRWFRVDDSREGWSKIVEILETAAWQEKHADKLFVFDFSGVRAAGTPIMGLQGRPASGPIPLMDAIARVASVKSAGMKPWKQALFVDHYLAECVQMGGVRRSARMAVKSWRDRDVVEFIDIKRGGHLDTANNSLSVDAEFWERAREPQPSHARRVLEAAVGAAYFDRTGEPGFINVDRLAWNSKGEDGITGDNCIDPAVYVDLHPRTREMIGNVLMHVKKLKYRYAVNPCAEIVLASWGGYCVIGEVNLAQVECLDDATDAVRMLAAFLVRCNRMKCEYSAEVKRTNRIGVGLTGIHEFAWRMFGLTFRDLIDGDSHRFWSFLADLRLAAEHAADEAADRFGMSRPHTVTTVKPSGTVSKVLGVTEGAHLPAHRHYLRWNLYKGDDPALADLTARGYPTENMEHRRAGHVAVGFPTALPIVDEMGAMNVVTAEEATPEEQFYWLMLLEQHWLGPRGNQVSYTLKYDPDRVSYPEFMATILEWQPRVRCCAVLPSSDWRKMRENYGYVPEQPIAEAQYRALVNRIAIADRQGYDDDALACESGVCPIEPDRT